METTALTVKEVSALTECERVIEAGQKTFVEVGQALLKIRESRLYRAEHGTFEEYCLSRWGMARSHAHRLIDAAAVTKNLSPIGDIPKTEAVVRPLTKLAPDQQREAWTKANEKAASENRPVTARDVGEMVVEIVPTSGRVGLSRQALDAGEIAATESENLWRLKSIWKKTGKADRKSFLQWAEDYT